MIKDVLYSIGTIVEVCNVNDEIVKYLIIGKRCINHETFKSWDYISVPFDEGFRRKFEKQDKEINTYENYFYFNHYEIERVVFIPDEELFFISKDEPNIGDDEI